MAKQKLDKWERRHIRNLARYEEQILQIYLSAIQEAANIGGLAGDFDPAKPFSFADFPLIRKQVNKLMKKMAGNIEATIAKGIDVEWELSEEKASELVQRLFKDLEGEELEERKRLYLTSRIKAREAFKERRDAGLNLSDKVWKYTDQFKEEIEMGLDLGLRDGKSAAELSRDLRQYLQYPDMLFRRVRDEHGILHLSKRAKAFHPGQGVYRSSYKNARRLAATETNMAYRNADYNRWQQMPFVVGVKINLSNNHTLNGEPFVDICDHLKGEYPKDFHFSGWHPLCRCFATPITMTDEELRADQQRRRRGEPSRPELSSRYVANPPEGFRKWITDHADRIATAKSLPYYIRQNQPFVKAALAPKELTPLEIAAKRHAARTPEQVQAIQEAWDARREKYRKIKLAANNVLKVAQDYGEVDYSALKGYIEAGDLKRMQTATRSTAADVLAMKKREQALSELIPNVHKLHHSYTMADLQEAYNDLDVVMKKWLKKYGYSSIAAAPLDHLKNKLDFELTSPTIRYSQKAIVKNSLEENIKITTRKIEWNELLAKATDLAAFKTRSSVFKGSVAKMEDAIRRRDFDALRAGIAEAEKQQQRLFASQIKRSAGSNTALNKEYKGGVVGRDITASFDATKTKSEDPFRGTFTNNVARLQGFDSPAKLVSKEEFAVLEKACGDVFYRTVNPTKFKGKRTSGAEFAKQMYVADKLEMNGSGGRYYGDGIYVASSAWDGRTLSSSLSESRKRAAYNESACYGKGDYKTLEMTWTRKPKMIKQSDLKRMWDRLSVSQQRRFGGVDFDYYANTYACALGYDGMYCNGPNYIVVWNRSIIAVKNG